MDRIGTMKRNAAIDPDNANGYVGSIAADEAEARRLISLELLIDALVWGRCRIDGEAAEELWVDLPTLRNRVAKGNAQ